MRANHFTSSKKVSSICWGLQVFFLQTDNSLAQRVGKTASQCDAQSSNIPLVCHLQFSFFPYFFKCTDLYIWPKLKIPFGYTNSVLTIELKNATLTPEKLDIVCIKWTRLAFFKPMQAWNSPWRGKKVVDSRHEVVVLKWSSCEHNPVRYTIAVQLRFVAN